MAIRVESEAHRRRVKRSVAIGDSSTDNRIRAKGVSGKFVSGQFFQRSQPLDPAKNESDVVCSEVHPKPARQRLLIPTTFRLGSRSCLCNMRHY